MVPGKCTTTLRIGGMTCANCSQSITQQLSKLSGVDSVDVSLITEEGVIVHDCEKVSAEALKDAVEACGFDAEVASSVCEAGSGSDGAKFVTKVHVDGMTCSNCTQSITQEVEKLPGVDSVVVSLITQEAVVQHDSSVRAETLQQTIEDCGFDAFVVDTKKFSSTVDKSFETVLSVKGMTCGACSASITKTLNALDGVDDCSVSLMTEQAKVKHSDKVTPDQLKEAIEDCGFDAEILESQGTDIQGLLETTAFQVLTPIPDINILQTISKFTGVDSIDTSGMLSQSQFKITYDAAQTGVRTIKQQARDDLNIDIEPLNKVDLSSQLSTLNKSKEIEFWKHAFIKTFLIGLPFFIVTHILPAMNLEVSFHLYHGIYIESVLELLFASYIQFGSLGLFFYKKAWNSLKHGSGTMDSLVCISTTISYVFSVITLIIWFFKDNELASPHTFFDTSVLLLNFVSLGKWMENKAKSETSSALSSLISLTSTDCTIVENYQDSKDLIKIPINYLQINDIVLIKPGEKIPTDGIVIEGESEVDESLITGESIPISKAMDDKVIGGSINGVGNLFIRVLSTSENSQLSKIIQMVKTAQINKAPIQSYADFVASIFVPTIVCLSVITFVCWIIICKTVKRPPSIFVNDSNGEIYVCLRIAISVIVVACPCALGLAAPTAVMVGTGVGALHGVLIKGGTALELSDKIDVILFDKTGTLTIGKMTVSNLAKMNKKTDLSISQVLDLIGNIESRSEHPIGVAITKYSIEQLNRTIFDSHINELEIKVGQGIHSTVSLNKCKYDVKIGNSKLVNVDNINLPIDDSNPNTIVHIEINNEYFGYLELSDIIKPDAVAVINEFTRLGYEIAMVTGDARKTANSISYKLGIPIRNVYSEVTPFGKEQLVSDLQAQGFKVAFVGDGINDSPALASADLGIAIASGTDIAIEAADVVIINNDRKISGVLYGLDISQATLRRIKWNFFWSWVYNLTMLPIAMGILIPWGIQLPPLAAAASMMISSTSVVLSSLLLKRWKPQQLNDDEPVQTKKFAVSWKDWLLRRKVDAADIELQTGLLRTPNE